MIVTLVRKVHQRKFSKVYLKEHFLCLAIFLLVSFPTHYTNGSVQSHDVGSQSCEILQPSESETIFDSKVEILAGFHQRFDSSNSRRRHSESVSVISVMLDGVLVGEAECPSRFTIKGITAGVHTLSLSKHKANSTPGSKAGSSSSSTASSTRNFFVAHSSFHPGQKWSPNWPTSNLDGEVCSAGEGSALHSSPLTSFGLGIVPCAVCMKAFTASIGRPPLPSAAQPPRLPHALSICLLSA